MRRARLAGWAALGLILGCGVRQPVGVVPLEGSPGQRSMLVGRWEGAYQVPGQARRGTVRFELAPGADTAHGEVEITFARALRLYGDDASGELQRRPSTVIAITMVALEGDTVRGALAPYWDPDCDCRAVAVFEGELMGDHIEGTFSTRREDTDSLLLRGTWSVRRQPAYTFSGGPAPDDGYRPRGRVTSTGSALVRTSLSATLPSTMRRRPPRPCVASAIMPMSGASAAAWMAWTAEAASTAAQRARNPDAFTAAAMFDR